jgi:hypothetical protein
MIIRITIMMMIMMMMIMMMITVDCRTRNLCNMKVGVEIYAFTSSFNVLFSTHPATASWYTGSTL